jgi:hypothetical protein
MPIINMVYKKKQGWKPWANTIAYYPLTANANDYSGNGYNATNYGGTFSEENWCYFWIAASRLVLPSMTIWQTFTISAWIKLPNWQPTWNLELDIYREWEYSYRNIFYSCVAWWIACHTWNNGTSSNAKTVSATFWTWWNNIILSKNWTSYSIYQNGVLLETFSSAYNISIPWWSTPTNIWHDVNSTSEYSAFWYIKDHIIEDKARTAQEVADYYNSTKSNYGL